MHGTILVLNAGSSSVKFSVFHADGDTLDPGPTGQVEGIGAEATLSVHGLPDGDGPDKKLHDVHDAAGAVQAIHRWLVEHHAGEREVAAIGHRVVHGGLLFDGPVRIDAAALRGIESLVPMAPLHQPSAIAAIRAVTQAAPDVAQYACFDTSFHRGQPHLAQLYAIPRALTESGIRGYGFHGLSYEYIASVLPPEIAGGRVVVAHLGSGASLCAMRAGRSVATTMGFTALDGVPMGTRCGDLDPGIILYLQQERGLSVADIEDLLYHRSGLLGVSGVSSDMRKLQVSDDPACREAVALFAYRITRAIGSLAAALGGLDGLVFTGGIGEHDAALRAEVVTQSRWLGLALDGSANAAHGPRLSPAESAASAWMIPTDENRMIARHITQLHS